MASGAPFSTKRSHSCVGMGRGDRQERETTDPELAEHRWDIDRAQDRVAHAVQAFVKRVGA